MMVTNGPDHINTNKLINLGNKCLEAAVSNTKILLTLRRADKIGKTFRSTMPSFTVSNIG